MQGGSSDAVRPCIGACMTHNCVLELQRRTISDLLNMSTFDVVINSDFSSETCPASPMAQQLQVLQLHVAIDQRRCRAATGEDGSRKLTGLGSTYRTYRTGVMTGLHWTSGRPPLAQPERASTREARCYILGIKDVYQDVVPIHMLKFVSYRLGMTQGSLLAWLSRFIPRTLSVAPRYTHHPYKPIVTASKVQLDGARTLTA